MNNTKKKSTQLRKELREFGVIFALGITLVFALFIPWLTEKPIPFWSPAIALGLIIIALIIPIILKPVQWIWLKIGTVLGWINTRLILMIIFFLVILPMGLIMRLFKDPMSRRIDKKAISYRIQSIPSPSERLERPF